MTIISNLIGWPLSTQYCSKKELAGREIISILSKRRGKLLFHISCFSSFWNGKLSWNESVSVVWAEREREQLWKNNHLQNYENLILFCGFSIPTLLPPFSSNKQANWERKFNGMSPPSRLDDSAHSTRNHNKCRPHSQRLNWKKEAKLGTFHSVLGN